MKKYLYKGSFIIVVISLLLGMIVFTKEDAKLSAQEDTIMDKIDGLEMNKTANANEDGTYTISLESYVTGEIKTITKAQPIDFVFALDISGSMQESFDGTTNGESKLSALQTASKNFLTSIEKDAETNQVNHRIAMVTFSSYNKSGVIGGDTYSDYYSNEAYKKPENLLRDTYKEGSTIYHNDLKEAINNLTADGSTEVDLGTTIANTVLESSPDTGEKRQQVVVVFSDGAPTGNYGAQMTADAALRSVANIKNKNALVYTVAIPDSEPSPVNQLDFLQYLSTNYPNAISLSNTGTKVNDKYALLANNASELDQVFQSIREDVSTPSISLDETTILKDIVSPYFDVMNASDIQVYTSEYQKDGTWAEKQPYEDAIIEFMPESKTINVSGFNYTENFVAINETTGEARGKKIVVDIKVSKKAGFIGGNNVSTNTSDAGIYVGEDPLQKFPVPSVNVPLDFEAVANDKSIYIGTLPTDMDQILDADINTVGTQFKDVAGNTYTLDGFNNEFVDIMYAIKDESGKTLATYTVAAGKDTTKELGTWLGQDQIKQLVQNTPVTIETNLKYKGESDIVSTKSKDATIHVFTPTIEVEDDVIFYGESINLNDQVVNVDWSCTDSKATTPTGSTPTLTYKFADKDGNITSANKFEPSETGTYKVSVLNQDLDISAYSKIENKNQYENDNFKVQVVKGELVIEKEIDAQYSENEVINAEQSFKFRIDVRDEKNGEIKKTYYQTIQFSANEKVTSKSITIKGLKKGYYTISEVDTWSWRYGEDTSARKDNYKENGTTLGGNENQSLYIGDRNIDNTGSKLFYGSESDTIINGKDHGMAANVYFKNVRNTKNVVGDVASAINKFMNK